MKSFALATLSVASLAVAQNMSSNSTAATTYATGLLATLQAANLTTLATIATANAAALLPVLMAGNHTVFAPTNEAFAALPASVTSNATLVAEVVSYHLLAGAFPASGLTGANTIAPTLLNSSDLVNLPGGAAQAIVLTAGANMSVTVVQPTTNVTSVGTAIYQNLIVQVIPTVLTVPGNVTATASAAGLTSLVGAVGAAGASLATTLNTVKGLTLFAPSNAAFAAIMSTAATLNATQISTVLQNHVILGAPVYSSLIKNGQNATTASGQTLTLITNSTGAYVQSGTIVARITRTDVLVNNGVVHLIDQVLVNLNSNPAAASSAAAVAATATATATGMSSTGTASAGTASATAKSSAQQIAGSLGAIGVAAFAMLV